MKKARMLGNYVESLIEQKKLSISELIGQLGCEKNHFNSFLKGRMFLSYPQLIKLSECLGVSMNELLEGDENYYNKTVVHCMNGFDNPDNREMILDIIDDYMDIVDAVDFSK